MNTRRELSELVYTDVPRDPMGRPLAATHRKVIARWLARQLPDPGTFESEYLKWAGEIEDGTLDLGEVARAIDEIRSDPNINSRGRVFNFRRQQWLKRKGA